MSYGANNWDAFWNHNTKVLSPSQKTPFMKNFAVMCDILRDYFDFRWEFGGLKTLEIGAGRGTISDMFKQRACNTTCSDIFGVGHEVTKQAAANHRYIQHDILRDQPLEEKFDIIITYGLLEHFDTERKIEIFHNTYQMLSDPGIELHYVVPRKWTNRGESKDVYRDRCKDLLSLDYLQNKRSGIVHVFPYFKKMNWVCSGLFSKGFIIWNGR